MRKSLPVLTFVAFLAAVTLSLLAAPPASTQDSSPDSTSVDSRVDALLAMPADARRAQLKAMSPDERRGLWFTLKKAQLQKRNATKNAQGAYREGNLADPKPRTVQPAVKAAGTIQYDDGSGSTTFGGGSIIGNRFDTHSGSFNVTTSGTVETVVAVVAQGPAFSSSTAGFVLLNEQTGGGGAMAAFSTFTSGGFTAATETVTFAGLGAAYAGESFFVLFGDFASSYVPVFDTGTTQGQGHHGVVGYTGGMGPNITGTFDFGNALNSLVRVTGNVLPVELISFEAE